MQTTQYQPRPISKFWRLPTRQITRNATNSFELSANLSCYVYIQLSISAIFVNWDDIYFTEVGSRNRIDFDKNEFGTEIVSLIKSQLYF